MDDVEHTIDCLNEEELYWEDWLDYQEYQDDLRAGRTNMPFDLWKISKYIQKMVSDAFGLSNQD